jgi:molybdopterin/thiamine biosynthesis adenylyltransferase
MNRLKETIKKESTKKQDPKGGDYLSLSTHSVASIAEGSGLSPRVVEIEALQWGAIPERYQRNMGTIGIDGQVKLLNSSVAVVGAGGLGGSVIEMLARAGVGRLHVIDHDVFSDSNLNRQILCSMRVLGEAKVDAAVKRVAGINPSVEVIPYAVEADENNILNMIEGCQVVVDALDNIRSRLCVEKRSKEMGIPFVHGAIAGFLGQVMTIFPQDEGLAFFYGNGTDDGPGMETKLGTPGMTPFFIASLQVAEVIKVLLAWPRPVRNKLLIVDLKKMVHDVIDFGDP